MGQGAALEKGFELFFGEPGRSGPAPVLASVWASTALYRGAPTTSGDANGLTVGISAIAQSTAPPAPSNPGHTSSCGSTGLAVPQDRLLIVEQRQNRESRLNGRGVQLESRRAINDVALRGSPRLIPA